MNTEVLNVVMTYFQVIVLTVSVRFVSASHSTLVTAESRPALQTEGLEVGSAYTPMPRPRMAVLHARMVSLKSTTL